MVFALSGASLDQPGSKVDGPDGEMTLPLREQKLSGALVPAPVALWNTQGRSRVAASDISASRPAAVSDAPKPASRALPRNRAELLDDL
jgi:hypothetical protein